MNEPTIPETGVTRPQDGPAGTPAAPCLPDAENEPQTGAQRRERFRTAVYQAIERGDDPAEAAMAVADGEQAELRDERDRAIRVAVALENELAAVRGLHVDSYTTRGVGRGTDTPPDYWTPYCTHDSQTWPCDTVRAIEEQP